MSKETNSLHDSNDSVQRVEPGFIADHIYSEPQQNGNDNGNANEKELSDEALPRKSDRQYLSRTARILILVPVTLTYFLWFLDLAVVSTATPAITSEFNSLVDVGW